MKNLLSLSFTPEPEESFGKMLNSSPSSRESQPIVCSQCFLVNICSEKKKEIKARYCRRDMASSSE